MDEKKKSENLIQNIKYEGYGNNITRTTANFAMLKQQMNKDKFEDKNTSMYKLYFYYN